MTRVLTAAGIILLLAGVLWLPWPFLLGAVVLVTLLAWRELHALARAAGAAPAGVPGALLAAAGVAAFVPGAPGVGIWIAAAVPAAALEGLVHRRRDPAAAARRIGVTLAGLAWLGIGLGSMVGLRLQPRGLGWLLTLIVAVSLGDVAAYYGGSALGRRPLAPTLSPKKTLEGSGFGLLASAAGAVTMATVADLTDPVTAAALGIGLGVAGQAGDLVESTLKRAAGRKDSSSLLPGHGGVLDRIDAHLLAAPVLWLLLQAPEALRLG